MKYWISKNDQKYGPYTLDQIRRNLEEGTILLTDYIHKDKEWVSLSQFLEDRKRAIKSPQQNVHGATVTEELKSKKPEHSIEEKLTKIKELVDKNLIEKDEYDKLKQKYLSEL